MFRFFLVLALAAAAGNTAAQVYRCKDVDGHVQYADRPCRLGDMEELVPDRVPPVTPEQRQDAQQRMQQLRNEAARLDAAHAATRAEQSGATSAPGGAGESSSASDAEAMRKCVRDVERQGAPENVRAEMLAACRTAGRMQHSTGLAGEAVDDCVRSVERTGAASAVKAREIARCHGGDVQPEPLHYPPRYPGKRVEKSVDVTGCNDRRCTGAAGKRDTGTKTSQFRPVGQVCLRTGSTSTCNFISQ